MTDEKQIRCEDSECKANMEYRLGCHSWWCNKNKEEN
jgi:hypothetical protein